MADSGAKMSFTPKTLDAMFKRAVAREVKRISEEITARAEVERSLGNEETALVLGEIVESIQPVPVKPDMNKLIVKGLEDEPRTTYFASDSEDGDADGGGVLPPVHFSSDEADVSRIVRKLG